MEVVASKQDFPIYRRSRSNLCESPRLSRGFTYGNYLVDLLEEIRGRTPSLCLEVETYTWDVLPAEYRKVGVAEAVARELAWVREQMNR